MKEHKKKERLDVLLVKRGLAESREKAKAIIMTGNVFVKEQREDKAGSTFDEDVVIEVKGAPMKYVSRGGYKLEKAMELWQVPLEDKVCMDAIDVGTNQLAWKLRQDERVVSMEKTNIRYVTHENVPDEIGFSSIDVAFISLTKVLVPVRNLLESHGQVVCLIKPQFEAGKDKVGKKGVVRDKKVHLEVVRNIITYAVAIGFEVIGLSFSPIKGPEGNIEYLLYIEKNTEMTDTECEVSEEKTAEAADIYEEKYAVLSEEIVEKAHQKLDI